MKIVITARNFSSCTDAHVRLLEQAGHTVLDYTHKNIGSNITAEELLPLIDDAEVLIAGAEPITADILAACPNLKCVSRRGIGCDSVDQNACKANGIALTRTVGAVEGAVAELALAYLLHFGRNIALQNRDMHNRVWKRIQTPGLQSKTLGLIGFGGIGKELARRAKACGMQVLYTCRRPDPAWDAAYGVTYLPQNELLAKSDYVAMCVPLNDSTRGMCNADFFARMKQGSVYINVARGQVADYAALRAALDSGHLAGAAIDVFDYEPCTDSLFVGCENVILTPHTGSFTVESFEAMNRMAAQNVLDWANGCLPTQNQVVTA